ncbi:unnamed protein product [Pleuronectes platessa]|uniref:CTLH domain-containing protein n=1 Tax=Pleuronectes platessa TaxID=8262 RepID=A0A9N7W330_PLEPL|nr:unnamed protein product [Pleuronectes platessa]
MNRLIMNYLVTEGFKEAAEKFRDILKGQIQDAIALINSLHPELLDTNRYLYFHLQQQHLIELIRLRETRSCSRVRPGSVSGAGGGEPRVSDEMERTLALLAFDNPEESPSEIC